jgi:hypothetical protein
MPDGFQYASGSYSADEGKPSSAFSQGDLLMLTSVSSLSRVNPYAIEAGAEVYGVATCDSTQSVRNLCTVLRPNPDTIFRLPTNAGSTLSKGASSGVSFVVATGRYYAESGGTAVVAVIAGVADCDQSVQSHVLVRIESSGALVDTI